MAITGIKLRCPLALTKSIKVTSQAGWLGGRMIQQNDVVAVVVPPLGSSGGGTSAPSIATSSVCGAITYAPGIMLPCETAATGSYTVGSKVYFDSGNLQVTETASGNVLCGTVKEAPATGATEVHVDFDGSLGIVS